MSPSRAPSVPPLLQGFQFQQLLGSGGFADVFLYSQNLPKRRVAVKVLLADQLRVGSVDEFTAEANVMAMLSTHPSIVTIYQAGVSDDGRPYLVMEYCPKPNLQVRYRRERFGVGEALRVAIQVAGAVETSHRAGILHRDIKPANILVTEYNRPALTDFGISATTTGGDATPVGMSIPWSPPESFASPAWSGAASDVYALAATVYTLLAGRSPFQLPGASNTSADVISRIVSAALQPLGRADVPASLETALATAMNKRPEDRYGSALEFARALQKVQIELAMSVTPVDVLDDSIDAEDDRDDDDGLTRVRSVVSIDPGQSAATSSAAATSAAWGATADSDTIPPMPAAPPVTAVPSTRASEPDLDPTALRGSATAAFVPFASPREPTRPELEQTFRRPDAPAAGIDETEAPGRRRWLVPTITASVLVVLVGAVGLALALGGTTGAGSAQPSEAAVEPVDAVAESAVPAPTDLAGLAGPEGIVFTWSNPEPEPGDVYLWRTVVAGEETAVQTAADTAVVVPVAEAGQTCLEVSIRRDDGRSSTDPAFGCAP